MSYCHDCDEEFETGTILCPNCGGKLAEGDVGDASAGWSDGSSDGSDATSGWSTDDSGIDDSTAGWSTDRNRDPAAASGPGSPDPSEPKYHSIDIFTFSFKYPLGKGGKPLVIDSVFTFFWFLLLIPLIVSYGYSYRVGRAAARGDEEVPSFDDWPGMGRDGLILVAVYLAVVIALAAVTAVISLAVSAVGESSTLALPIIGIGTIAVLAGSYIAGAIVPVLIGTGSLSKTFSDRRILEFALSMHYLKGILLLFVISIGLYIAFAIGAFILAITIIGIPLVLVLYIVFPVYLVNLSFALWGYIYNEAAKAGDVEPVEPDASLGFE
ncbi:hypothetical protein CP557_10790 [Natrinema ejinorense]|uniref:DUF4013 domain-containing protein n=1 Tax=Natrinema ejinorense TaxID=373386 RepID=A0A2A5QVV8_9EURY|nr:hypothetical protein CP557_10790 [Natrinema ejinorense]